ncbi:MAG: hypothetical protein HWN81_03725 [Candidatus Lokiarchaeota archaeon]|nr:hypothetical protein [Candidatus Lokiarchaeota archaeon]
MDPINELSSKNKIVRVAHDLQRQILEMTSFLRVMNNYYKKKITLQNQIKPLILRKFKEELKSPKDNRDWLLTIPTALDSFSENILNQKDSFKFPYSIMLFEAWMHLGIQALYPRIVMQFKFPGLLKGEKTRNLFQFIFSTSRGFGFPINFGPEFYRYRSKLTRIFDPLLKWAYTVSHRANQAIVLGNKRLKSKRHHPGEFESVLISEYYNNEYKGIDTLLHGYFKIESKILGKFSSIDKVLQNSTFYYSIGDHAMRIEKHDGNTFLTLPLITHGLIVKKYGVDFNSYVKLLLDVNNLLIKKINMYKKKRNNLISQLNKTDKIKFRLEQSKHFAKKIARMSQKLSKKYPIIDKYSHYKTLLEKIRKLLFTTPLYMHAIHDSKEGGNFLNLIEIERENVDEYKQESVNSIVLGFIENYEKKYNFNFDEEEVVLKLAQLRDYITKMWLFFKERHFKFTLEKLKELSIINMDNENYEMIINELLDKLLPIIAIYEIFNRPLFESVYPEFLPQTKRPGTYFARFLASKYNPIGTNLMKLFNRLAFHNWSYLIIKKGMNRREFFNYLLKLPIWKYIPTKLKIRIIQQNN